MNAILLSGSEVSVSDLIPVPSHSVETMPHLRERRGIFNACVA